jgi:hypothetical protein
MDLMPYEKLILEIFADSFPLSAHFKNGRNLRKSGWGRIFPKIKKSAEEKDAFLTAVESLCRRGILSASWKKFREGDELTALYLEDPEGLYRLLDKKHPDDIRKNILERLKNYTTKNKLESDLVQNIIVLLKARHPLPFKDENELFNILKLASVTQETVKNFTLRALSVHLFNDSKEIESIIWNADKLTEKICSFKLSDYLGLKRAYPEASYSGNCKLQFKDNTEWQLNGHALSIPLETCNKLNNIKWNKTGLNKVLCIENKETFYIARHTLREFSGFVYTAGHANTAVQVLLDVIKKSGAELFHFGDMDPDGLLIFQELHKLSGGILKPYMMNEEIYKEYLKYGYSLKKNSLARLELVKTDVILPLAELIKKNRIGIEQEILPLK